MSSQEVCASCDRPTVVVGAGVNAIIDGKHIRYLLCVECADLARAQPEEMADKVELRLREAQGNA